MNEGFLKLMRGSKTLELLAYPNELALLTQIALRARRSQGGINSDGLEPGEALIGDYKSIGLTERKYRTAKQRLAKWQISTFKTTNRGTIAKLVNKDIYDINAESNDEQNDKQATSKRQASDEQATTNKKARTKELKNEKNSLQENSPPVSSLSLQSGDNKSKPPKLHQHLAVLMGRIEKAFPNRTSREQQTDNRLLEFIINQAKVNSEIALPWFDQIGQFAEKAVSDAVINNGCIKDPRAWWMSEVKKLTGFSTAGKKNQLDLKREQIKKQLTQGSPTVIGSMTENALGKVTRCENG